ncbi:MAG: VOC family protein [Planctomycetes bacterium]|nr:VOC family protein [Planctomycetota bacterium]
MADADLALTILYVSDLPRAAAFYDAAFAFQKTVDVPAYVEYRINTGARLGLMPQENTRHFLGDVVGKLTPTDGCPRAELYVHVRDLESVIQRLQAAGARCTSPLAERDWGERAAYFMDCDGYVIAVANRLA